MFSVTPFFWHCWHKNYYYKQYSNIFTLWFFSPKLHPECLSVQKKDDYDPLSDSSQLHCQVSFGKKTELTDSHTKKKNAWIFPRHNASLAARAWGQEDGRTDWRRVLGLVRALDAERPLLACLNRTPSTSLVAPSPGGPASPWTTGSCKAVPQKQKQKSTIGTRSSSLAPTVGEKKSVSSHFKPSLSNFQLKYIIQLVGCGPKVGRGAVLIRSRPRGQFPLLKWFLK